MGQQHFCTTVIALFGFMEVNRSSAFVIPQHQHQLSSTALKLKTGQGNQLAAAFNAANCKDYDDEDASSIVNKLPTSTAVQYNEEGLVVPGFARTFVQRVFSLPSSMIHRHPHPKVEGLSADKGFSQDKSKQDIVYYPVVGFTFCKNGDRVVALPTTSNVSCSLPRRSQEVFGWYSPVCKLDLYSEDPCHVPFEDIPQ